MIAQRKHYNLNVTVIGKLQFLLPDSFGKECKILGRPGELSEFLTFLIYVCFVFSLLHLVHAV